MMPSRVIQVIVGALGFISVFGSAFFAKSLGWTASTATIVAFGIGIGTVAIELTISFYDLRENIVKLYPSLDFSVSEQRQIYSLITNLNHLRQVAGPAANIALSLHAEAGEVVAKATQGSDFEVDNMFLANVDAMRSLKPGERFLGLSAIINPDHWDYDPDLIEYKRLNYQQASVGVNVQRTFVLKDETEFQKMLPIMQDQANHSISVTYLFESELPKSQFFFDFTVLPERSFALYVPKVDKLLTCIATQSSTIVAELEQTIARIKSVARKIEAVK